MFVVCAFNVGAICNIACMLLLVCVVMWLSDVSVLRLCGFVVVGLRGSVTV